MKARRVYLFGTVLGVTASAAHADKVYWVQREPNEVRFANRDGTSANGFAIGTFPLSIALDVIHSHIYWKAASSPPRIHRANLDGSNPIIAFMPQFEIGAIALDPAAQRIYWTSTGSYNDAIGRVLGADLDGSNQLVIAELQKGMFSFGIDVDVLNAKVYWTDIIEGQIFRANSHGGGVEVVLDTSDSLTDLALDLLNGRIYWGTCQGGIYSANVNGTGIQVIIPKNPDICVAGIDVDPLEGKIYWTDQGVNQGVHRSNLDGTGAEVLSAETFNVWDLSLDTLPPPPPVPTLSTWGLSILLLASLVGAFLIRSRFQVQAE